MNKDEFLQQLGLRIKKLRMQNGMSQRELCLIIDKEQKSLNRIENGQVNAGVYMLHQIAEGLGVSLSELVDF